MAGSHEVRGSIPLGSTTDTRGARRRRRAPLFCFRAHRTERAYRTKSVSHSGASARAGAPFSFARIRRPRLSARAESAPPPRMGIARPGRAPAPRARRPRRIRSAASRRSAAGRGRIRRWAASAPPSSGMRDCPRGKRLASRRESAAGSDAPSSLAISEAPSPSARRRLIYEMAGMPTISLPAPLDRLPRRRPK